MTAAGFWTAKIWVAATWIAVFWSPLAVESAEFADGLTAEQIADGWISLFDGRTLFGWTPAADANWTIEDGTLVVSEGEVGLLRTTSQFADYILRVDFRADVSTNSGVFLRTSPRPARVDADCYELNIAPPDNPFPTGSLVGRIKSGSSPTTGQWQTFEARLEAGRVTISLDGQQVLEYDDPRPLGRGYIGLQHNSGRVAFRNVFLKPLGLQSLLGDDLRGWRTHPDLDGEFTIEPGGTLRVRGGRGQLETESLWGDFVLQFAAMTHGVGVNSGIFLRCIPGQEMMGYESQIHHGVVDGDRNRPEDCGTGGIFRRVDARRVVSDDQAWLYQTVIVEGPHFAVWVNGIQVTDWTDTRRSDENPRRGLRTAAGSLMLQAHDATTDLSFRHLRAVELTERRPVP